MLVVFMETAIGKHKFWKVGSPFVVSIKPKREATVAHVSQLGPTKLQV